MIKPEIGKYYKKRYILDKVGYVGTGLRINYTIIRITEIREEKTIYYEIIYFKYKDGSVKKHKYFNSMYLNHLNKHYTLEPYETMVEFCKKLKRSRCR